MSTSQATYFLSFVGSHPRQRPTLRACFAIRFFGLRLSLGRANPNSLFNTSNYPPHLTLHPRGSYEPALVVFTQHLISGFSQVPYLHRSFTPRLPSRLVLLAAKSTPDGVVAPKRWVLRRASTPCARLSIFCALSYFSPPPRFLLCSYHRANRAATSCSYSSRARVRRSSCLRFCPIALFTFPSYILALLFLEFVACCSLLYCCHPACVSSITPVVVRIAPSHPTPPTASIPPAPALPPPPSVASFPSCRVAT